MLGRRSRRHKKLAYIITETVRFRVVRPECPHTHVVYLQLTVHPFNLRPGNFTTYNATTGGRPEAAFWYVIFRIGARLSCSYASISLNHRLSYENYQNHRPECIVSYLHAKQVFIANAITGKVLFRIKIRLHRSIHKALFYKTKHKTPFYRY